MAFDEKLYKNWDKIIMIKLKDMRLVIMETKEFKKFKLSKEILEALEVLGYSKPSEVQEEVLPLVLNNEDIIVKSETGSGKTAAFGIPLCENIEIEERSPQALILTPTRELALQIKEEISNIGRLKRIRVSAIFGKQPMDMQVRELKQRVHVVVGTPGRTFDHIEKGSLDISKIKYLVIDEADKMLNMGFIDQVEVIVKKLPTNRVTMLFSATIDDKIKELCEKHMTNPKMIEINSKSNASERIEQVYYEVDESEKFKILNNIIYTERPESCIIFCGTKEVVDDVEYRMRKKGYSCHKLHGGMEQKDRLDIMQRFKRGEFKFLVATDLAARGIHIENITHVINYDTPVETDSYVHRIGRTGRAGTKGKALTFVSPKEVRLLNEIEKYIGYKIARGKFPTEEEVEEGKKLFKDKSKTKPKLKSDKSARLSKDITKLHINAGKKKKIRPGDIVGAVTSIEGISADDVGIIDVQPNFTYVDILNKKGGKVLKELQNVSIKGKKVKVERAEK